MNRTPQSNRLAVSLFGRCNAGKSSLFNQILGADCAIVSETPGTTTDPVSKAMELLPLGPILLTDTAGFGDGSPLQAARWKKTTDILNRTHLAVYVMDGESPDKPDYDGFQQRLMEKAIPHLLVLTKKDRLTEEQAARLQKQYPKAILVSAVDATTQEILRQAIAESLKQAEPEDQSLLGGLLTPGQHVLLVIPLDSEAPKSRLILPQVQFMRHCLDEGLLCTITTLETLPEALQKNRRYDLAVTDSQAFAQTEAILPKDIPLTSFSILMARQKGDLPLLTEGLSAISSVRDGDHILIAEACTHSVSHQDIGRVKIPALLRKLTGKELNFHFTAGKDFNPAPDPPAESPYAFIVHCGGCMNTRREMLHRLWLAKVRNIPVTNYGVLLAFGSGILSRSLAIFKKEDSSWI